MTRVEIDTNLKTRCCINCPIYCQNKQIMLIDKLRHNGKTFYATRVEPCETILEETRFSQIGNLDCKASLQESAYIKRN